LQVLVVVDELLHPLVLLPELLLGLVHIVVHLGLWLLIVVVHLHRLWFFFLLLNLHTDYLRTLRFTHLRELVRDYRVRFLIILLLVVIILNLKFLRLVQSDVLLLSLVLVCARSLTGLLLHLLLLQVAK
jgi:hypothetical protein